MKNEIYFWVAVVVIVAIAALLFRYLYQPSIDIGIGVHGSIPAHLYPYQKVVLSILAANNGTAAIENMSLGVFVNGNLSTLYKVTLPAGKQTTIYYNYSPTEPGAYNILVEADPAKVYDIADRQSSFGSISFSANASTPAAPWVILPGNYTYSSGRFLSAGGYAISGYIYDNYGASRFDALPTGQAGTFIEPVLNLTYNYIKNMSIAEAQYGNYSAYSLWLKGYLAPGIFAVAARGANLTATSANSTVGNVTLIDMRNGTSFCSWYSQGWLKVLTVSSNTVGCMSLINASAELNTPAPANNISAMFGDSLAPSNTTLLGAFNGTDYMGSYAASLYVLNNASFISEAITKQNTNSNLCYGVLGAYDNVSYCSTYIVPSSGKLGSTALIETTAYKGGYNISALSLVNASAVLDQVSVAEGLLGRINVSGPSVAFLSGISSTCSLGSAFGCSNLTYDNGTVSVTIRSMLNESARINSAGCYKFANIYPTPENKTLAPGALMALSLRCYNMTTPISGVALNLHTNLGINYTIGSSTVDDVGSAFIPFG